MKNIKISISSFFFFLFISSFSQVTLSSISEKLLNNKEDKALFNRAESLFNDANYSEALPFYQRLLLTYPEDGMINYRVGVCFLSRSDMPEKSLEHLRKAQELGFSIPEFSFYMGRALHLNYLFNDARTQFQNTLAALKMNKEIQAQAKIYLEYCKNASEQIALPADVSIKNLGKDINSIWSEYVPIISSDEVFLLFTYRGVRSMGGLQSVYDGGMQPDSSREYCEDIFYSYKIGNHWLIPDPIVENINTTAHDAAVALSADGQKLFIFKSTAKDNGDIYMSRLEGNTWTTPVHLDKNINSNSWEGSCSLSADEKILYFSSERSGGFGGKDIWKSEIQPNGLWGKAINLGPIINTQYDEDGPFIHPDGEMLHYSSNGIKSMGGYDVFRTYLKEDGTWTKPDNLSYPLNTVDDDIYYVVSADGARGYYSSARAGGYGMQDIYEVKPGITGKKSALIAIKGTITLDDSPVKARVIVLNTETEKEFGEYVSNSSTGKYLINLPTGSTYKIYYRTEGAVEEQIKSFNTENVNYYLEATIDVAFYTSDILAKRAKNKLTIFNKDGTIFKTGTQMRDGRFLFNYLPADDDVRFQLEGENVEFMNKVTISVTGIQKTLLRGKDGFFRYEYLIPGYDLLLPIARVDSLMKNPVDMTYAEIVDHFGKNTSEGMSFTVQVGAYYEAQNFNYSHLVSIGKIETRNYNDGVSRFTIGDFSTLVEAEEMRKRIVTLGGETTDAFVLAVYKGKRILMKDLAERHFYSK